MTPEIIGGLLNQGLLGLMFILIVIGILVPKYVVDEFRVREKGKDIVIERLTAAVEKLGDQLEARK